ncbi:MAG: sigma-70 family RNA polymerase sigma factor [Pseudomonadota bacterium]
MDRYRGALYRYARLRVHEDHLAEDLVQETLLAAYKSRDRFAGNASEKTWLIGILKHKIVDYFRRASRETGQEFNDAFYSPMDACFDEQGHWQFDIADWSRPDTALEQAQFWQILSDCVERLPPRLARLFVLRELDGLPSEEICQVLDISTTNNLWVMLSRMRMQLRNCLDMNWFNKGGN